MRVTSVHRAGDAEPSARTTTYLRFSITDKCDLACAYCVPYRHGLGCANSTMPADRVATLVRAFARNGVTKVRLTGGEPLLHPDVVRIVRSIANTPGINTVGLTTNGVRLAELAPDLKLAGLNAVNISLDTLDRGTFQRMAGRDVLDSVIRGVYAALAREFERVKINVVVMRGMNDAELPRLAGLSERLGVEVRFIELMPLGHTADAWSRLYVSASEIRRRLGNLRPLPSDHSSSATLYSIGGRGRIGIISPMSECFCAGCNRIRVTSSGKLKSCLRLPFEEDISGLRDDPDLAEKIGALMTRLSCHKLAGASTAATAVQSGTMCSVGG